MSYQTKKVGELKDELKKRGLPTTGKKDELVQRLISSDSNKGGNKEENSDNEVSKEVVDEAEKKKEKGKGKRKLDEVEEEETEEAPVNKKATKEKETTKEKSTKSGDSENILDHLTDEGWKDALKGEFSKAYFQGILKFLDKELKNGAEIFPPRNEIFSALNYTPIDKVRVVILGQDPYHDNLQANGLCFSVREGITHPPSLKNIFKELTTDIPGFTTPKSGSLEKWAHRGVLLLNATLTVQAHQANSHKDCGWMEFTDAVIKVLNKKASGVVFILWGGFAQKKGKIIDKSRHHVIQAAHPSPLSVTKFWGCKVFSKTNDILKKDGKEPIDWSL